MGCMSSGALAGCGSGSGGPRHCPHPHQHHACPRAWCSPMSRPPAPENSEVTFILRQTGCVQCSDPTRHAQRLRNGRGVVEEQ